MANHLPFPTPIAEFLSMKNVTRDTTKSRMKLIFKKGKEHDFPEFKILGLSLNFRYDDFSI